MTGEIVEPGDSGPSVEPVYRTIEESLATRAAEDAEVAARFRRIAAKKRARDACEWPKWKADGTPMTTTLTDDVQAKIISELANGNFRETAARAAGVNPKTLRAWLSKGFAGEEPYAAFAREVDRAEAESEARDVQLLRTAGADDWKAIAWRLERKAASRWQFKIRLEVQSEIDAFLARLERNLDPETFERVLLAADTDDGSTSALGTGGDESDRESPALVVDREAGATPAAG